MGEGTERRAFLGQSIMDGVPRGDADRQLGLRGVAG